MSSASALLQRRFSYSFFKRAPISSSYTELKLAIHLALEHQRMTRENARLLELLRAQADVIKRLESNHPGISSIRRDASGAILIAEDELAQPDE